MKGVLFLMFMFTVGQSLVMDAVNTSLTAHDFRQLVDLLVEEKHLRSQLENRVNLLEQRLSSNEGKVDTFNHAIMKEQSNRHQLAVEYSRLTLEFRNQSIDHNALLVGYKELRKEFLNLTTTTQDKLKKMEQMINDVNASLTQRASCSSEIKAFYQSINGQLANVNNQIANIESNVSSLRKDGMLVKQQVAAFVSDNKAINASLATNKADISANRVEIRSLLGNISSIQASVATNRADLTSNRAKITTNEAKISTNQAGVAQNQATIGANNRTITLQQTDIQQLKQHPGGKRSGFSAKGSKAGPSSGTLTFGTTLTNIGGHFSPTTGKFTCVFSGYYYFIAHIVKASSASGALCDIMKNSSAQVRVEIDPDNAAEDGYDVASNSVILHLNRGETVYLGRCSTSGNFYSSETSFTGFLISAD